jgi:hypothetical protein
MFARLEMCMWSEFSKSAADANLCSVLRRQLLCQLCRAGSLVNAVRANRQTCSVVLLFLSRSRNASSTFMEQCFCVSSRRAAEDVYRLGVGLAPVTEFDALTFR